MFARSVSILFSVFLLKEVIRFCRNEFIFYFFLNGVTGFFVLRFSNEKRSDGTGKFTHP